MKNKLLKLSILLSLTGAFLVSFNYPFYANVFWLPSNLYLSIYNFKINKEQSLLFFVFFCINIIGIFIQTLYFIL